MKKMKVRVAFNRSLVDGLTFDGYSTDVEHIACFSDKKNKCWSLVHTPTGLLLGNFKTRKECGEFVTDLARFDWSEGWELHEKAWIAARVKYLQNLAEECNA